MRQFDRAEFGDGLTAPRCQPTASAANASSQSDIAIAVEVADISDPEEFPEIARALEWAANLSPERRAELNGEWE